MPKHEGVPLLIIIPLNLVPRVLSENLGNEVAFPCLLILKKTPHYNIARYYFVSAMLSSGSASVLGAYGIFGFCLVVSNYFKYCIIHLFQIGMRGKKTKGI